MSLTTPGTIRRLQEALGTKAKQEPTYRFYLLHDKVYRADILAHAYALAKQRDGAPGVDGETFEAIEAAGRERWLAAVQDALQTETYRPQPVRRVMIPKPAGGERPLGIPTIRDRVVQTAVLLILQPIFEADLEPTAYGYRPGRTAREAVEAVHRALCAGQTHVVDADVSQYFDTIPHAALMQTLARRISDRKLLRLLKMWLKGASGGAGRRWRVAVYRGQASDARHPARRGHLAAAREPLHEPLPAGVPPGRVGAALWGAAGQLRRRFCRVVSAWGRRDPGADPAVVPADGADAERAEDAPV